MNIKKVIPIVIIIGLILIFNFSRKDIISINILQKENQQIVEKDFIYNHNDAISFPAVVRSSGNKPVETEYKGIEMSKLFYSLDLDISQVEKITFNASDGYRIILSIEEINEPNNVYLTFEKDGKPMKSKRQGGNGPFQLVIRRDPFSQRWIKHIEEIILE
ncbi:hypothetical protein [Schnuerera sp.]|uniref:hypothetical protein n=1 Tax=Schnuerera sp. TaxID=2794844 RepID=UPI002B8A6449|nr:hypothetical protein [Schnuerera sp.]HSH34830.1 hypothetical protein [Schnuerera sp.]